MVYFVGAGTGAADLITVRGMRLIKEADVVIYTGSLINPELLTFAKEECEKYNSAYLTLEEVLRIMLRAEAQGKMTVRLHTGEPSIYGAVREQMDELDKAGISYESCPGVSACFGAASSLNLEYTLPGISQSLIITRMEGKTEVPGKESIESFAAHQTSMAVYLSAGMLEELSRRLIEGGYAKETPAALVYKATWPEEEAYICTIETLHETAEKHGITKTAVVLVGDVVAHRNYNRSKLYDAVFSTEFRQAAKPSRKMDTTKPDSRKLSIISFTERGRQLSERIAGAYRETEVQLFSGQKSSIHVNSGSSVRLVESSVGEWTGAQMRERNAILFIGACGIAVRAAAPYLTDKLHDSPVLVMDEGGKYVIPILSGHVGGANGLALSLAEKTGAQPVITTATDINGKLAADVFARENGLLIVNKEGIARVSSKALSGKAVKISVEPGHMEMGEQLPKEVRILPYPPEEPVDVVVTSQKESFDATLLLKPKEYVIGMGCKRGKEADAIEAFILQTVKELGISDTQIFALASISQKQDEQGLVCWCRKKGISFLTYTAEELQAVQGEFKGSSFVKEQVGVDNVCERAALKACGSGGRLVCEKRAKDGMTIAVARREWKVSFYGK